jgi:hypothetical protein
VISDLKLQLLVPGETAAAGKWNNGANTAPFGKNGTPNAVTAGAPFTVTANLVDPYWNPVDGSVPQMQQSVQLIQAGVYDPYAVYPSSRVLSAGTVTFTLAFQTAGFGYSPSSWTLTLRDVDPADPYYGTDTSPDIVVNPGTAKQYLVVLPGETWVPDRRRGLPGQRLSLRRLLQCGEP